MIEALATETLPSEILRAISRFLESSLDPVLCEPGEEWLAITPENFVVEAHGACTQLQAWDQRRNLVRRVIAIERETRGKLVLQVARFGKLQGTLELIDRKKAVRDNLPLRSARLGFREQFRRFLRRQFPAYKLAELTTEADLEHTLSPAYPRALLRQGATAWAAIGAAADASHPDGVLTFGLIWLDYLAATRAFARDSGIDSLSPGRPREDHLPALVVPGSGGRAILRFCIR